MQRHVDIFRHKVIMGVHNKLRRDKNGDPVNEFERHSTLQNEDASAASFSAMDHMEIN